MNLTFKEFKELASEFNIKVVYLDAPRNSFNNMFVSVGEYHVKTIIDVIELFRRSRNTHIGVYLNDDGELFWFQNSMYYIRICTIPIKKDITERQLIYGKIDGERDYQDLNWLNDTNSNKVPDEDKSVAEWILYIEKHLDNAKHKVYYLNKNLALAEMRKIAALAVRCMEIHGCPERDINKPSGRS